MKTTTAKPFWQGLPPGRHVKRIGRKPGFTAFILVGKPGPVAVVNGGTHGDEYEGPTVLRELVDSLKPNTLTGTLVVIPVLHEEAFFAGLRCNPNDGGNLARVFPGDPKGTHTQQLADLFQKRVLAHKPDYYLDLHSGGVIYDLVPWCGYGIHDDPAVNRTQAEMSACFDDYWCWASLPNKGRTLSAAAEYNVPAIYTESLGGGGMAATDRAALNRGLDNFLKRFGFLKGGLPQTKPQPTRIATEVGEAHIQTHHPAEATGLFIRAVGPGDTVRKGSVIGTIHPLDGSTPVKVKASRAGTVVSLMRKGGITTGEAIATVVPIALKA